MRAIDDYQTEVMISLAIVMGGYALSHWLHVSGPVAMAVAGLLIGNHGVAHAMSDTTRDYLLKFWSLIDAILNAVLFLLIGLEILTLPADLRLLLLGLLAIPLIMGARTVSVLTPLALLRPVLDLGRLAPVTLIWGGMRGGISVALALGLPEGPCAQASSPRPIWSSCSRCLFRAQRSRGFCVRLKKPIAGPCWNDRSKKDPRSASLLAAFVVCRRTPLLLCA